MWPLAWNESLPPFGMLGPTCNPSSKTDARLCKDQRMGIPKSNRWDVRFQKGGREEKNVCTSTCTAGTCRNTCLTRVIPGEGPLGKTRPSPLRACRVMWQVLGSGEPPSPVQEEVISRAGRRRPLTAKLSSFAVVLRTEDMRALESWLEGVPLPCAHVNTHTRPYSYL